jgi:hypothetical protein
MRTRVTISFLALVAGAITVVTAIIAQNASAALYDGTKCILSDGSACGEPPAGSQPGACTTSAPCSGACSYCLGSFDGPVHICVATKLTSKPTTHCVVLESVVDCGTKYVGATCRPYFGSEFCYCPPVGSPSGSCQFYECSGDAP